MEVGSAWETSKLSMSRTTWL